MLDWQSYLEGDAIPPSGVFPGFCVALGHGLFSGTDSGMAWALIMYAVTGISVVAMTVYRIMASLKV